jgi:poly-gamma-glutamate capsule biosynthesis protein CapA/YwtB (metallophosphatase superfamily)
LHQMNVVAVSVANNHRLDLGPKALMDMVAVLRKEGFAVLQHGVTTNLKPLHIVALTDLDNHSDRQGGLASQSDLERIKARPPLAVFMHWGTERVLVPDERQRKLSRQLGARRVSLIVGAHPHVADQRLVCADDCKVVVAHSLGNFLFDQGARHASGSLLEIRVFEQGTVFARLVPIPNYFDRARQKPALN